MRTAIGILKSVLIYIIWAMGLALICTKTLFVLGYKTEMTFLTFAVYFAMDALSLVNSETSMSLS